MKIRELFEELEREIKKENISNRCPDYVRECVQCKFWKKFDELKEETLECEDQDRSENGK